MSDQQLMRRSDHRDGLDGWTGSDWACQAASDRAAAWSSDRVADPGDSHDKGEPSLCVGEAA